MAAKVLDTYELLEDILLHLPLRQLLLAQRVNKQFHAVIQDSLKINQVLFFKPATTTTVEWWPTAQIGRRIGSFTVSECIWTSKGEKSEQVVIVNPLSHMKAYVEEQLREACEANLQQIFPEETSKMHDVRDKSIAKDEA